MNKLGKFLNSLLIDRYSEQHVDWEKYSQQYDDVTINLRPPYQELIKLPFEEEFRDKIIYNSRKIVCDIAAGTGNFSIPLATNYPHLTVYHIDSSEQFIEIARKKADKQGIENIEFYLSDAEDIGSIVDCTGSPIDLAFMFHALYSMKDKDPKKPQRVLNNIYNSLKDGGQFFIADIQREMNYLHLLTSSLVNGIRKKGLFQTLNGFKDLDQAKKQNINIIKKQRSGDYIIQDLNEFKKMLEKSGFNLENILFESEFEYYDGYDNIIFIEK